MATYSSANRASPSECYYSSATSHVSTLSLNNLYSVGHYILSPLDPARLTSNLTLPYLPRCGLWQKELIELDQCHKTQYENSQRGQNTVWLSTVFITWITSLSGIPTSHSSHLSSYSPTSASSLPKAVNTTMHMSYHQSPSVSVVGPLHMIISLRSPSTDKLTHSQEDTPCGEHCWKTCQPSVYWSFHLAIGLPGLLRITMLKQNHWVFNRHETILSSL